MKIKNISIVSLSTIASRVLGLVRDILIFALLGAGAWSSAFVLAFTLPNLFRRLLGEGALTSALVPVFSDTIAQEGRMRAFDFLNQVLVRLIAILLGITSAAIALFLILDLASIWPPRWELGARLSAILFPYVIFICLAAAVSAVLQVLNRFTIASLTPVVLNLCMIGALIAGSFGFKDDPLFLVYALCAGVLLGGAFQLGLPVLDLLAQGWGPKLDIRPSNRLDELWHLFLPGIIGAAILQVNILVSRLLAYSLDESAVSLLYISSRLMELPLGVFTVAIITVYFPLLSKEVSAGNRKGFSNTFQEGLRLILSITIPAAVGLIVLADPILGLLFEWNAFGRSDVAETLPLLVIYGIGLPFYSIATFATRGFHASKDMKSPIIVAAVCLAINAVLGVILMQPWGASGLATANVIAAIVQAILLHIRLGREAVSIRDIVAPFSKILAAALIMGGFCWIGYGFLKFVPIGDKLLALTTCFTLIPLGGLVYFGVLYVLKFEDMQLASHLIRKKLRRS